MTAAILGATIPVGYVLMMACAFFICHVNMRNHGVDKVDAGFGSALMATFWPLALPCFLAWVLATRFEQSDGMTRKQRAAIAFERESAKVAAEAVQAQRDWQRLLDVESKS